jgi:uncharacterized protein (TIGR03437 family)
LHAAAIALALVAASLAGAPFQSSSTAPAITLVSPDKVSAGGPGFSLLVVGQNFVAASVVRWNGTALATAFINGSSLRADVPAALVAAAGIGSITVANPGGSISGSSGVIVASGPVLTGCGNELITAGGATRTITCTGTGFVSGATVYWNGTALSTYFVSASQLRADLPAALIASPGTAMFWVVNPGGAMTSKLGMPVVSPPPNPKPVITSAGGAILVGGPAVNLTVEGAYFVAGSVAWWNGAPIPTTFVSTTLLRATLPAGAATAAGWSSLTVVNPDGQSASIHMLVETLPVFDSMSPLSIAAGGPPFTLTVTGSGFAQAATVRWDGVRLQTTYSSESRLTATVPATAIANAGVARVWVANSDIFVSAARTFTITAASTAGPVVSGLSPASAAVGDPPFTLTVNGSGFVAGSTVTLNGAPLSTQYVSATRLQAGVPMPTITSAGSAAVAVVNPGGVVSAAMNFRITAPRPVLVSTSITELVAGDPGFTFTVSGGNFGAGATVEWNGAPLPTTVVSKSQLRATVSAAALRTAGRVEIAVRNNDGAASAVITIPIQLLELGSISPFTMPAGTPGLTLTAWGKFGKVATVLWNGAPLSTTWVDSMRVTAFVPANLLATEGTASVAVARVGGDTTRPVTFSVTAARRLQISRLSSTQFGATTFPNGATLHVAGDGFRPGAAVKWNSEFLQTTFENSEQLSAMVPEPLLRTPATAMVRVVNRDGVESNAMQVSVVVPTPRITTVTPLSAVAGGPAFTMHITGAAFYPGAKVRWDGEALETTLTGSTEARAVVPAARIAAPGTVWVTVANTPVGPFSNAAAFHIVAPSDRVTITRVLPNQAHALIPEFPIKVTGTGFVNGSVVRWNDAALATTFVNSTELSATVPPGLNTAPGPVSIVVVNPDGTQTGAGYFGVSPAVPTITSMNPSSRMAGAPRFTLALRGSGFSPEAVVRWSGARLPTTYVSYAEVTAEVPGAGPANQVPVNVENPDNRSISAMPDRHFLSVGWQFARCSPASAVAGGPSFSLTAAGENFLRGAILRWSGIPLETVFVDANTLRAAVPASLIATAGAASLTVLQPDGAASSAIEFPIRADDPGGMTITTGGVVNAASSQASIAPGSLISIYASNLPAGSAFAEKTPLPTTLNGVSVRINGVPAPLLFAGSSQVNAQVPFEIPPGGATVIVTAAGVSAEAPVEVRPVGPGILTMSGGNHAVAQNAADFTLNAGDNPARPGQYVILYLTGQGMVEPAVPTGEAAPATPLSYPAGPVEATIGGRPARVAFAGLTPGLVGVLQVNLEVPAGVSGEAPVEVAVGGMASPPAVLSVAN